VSAVWTLLQSYPTPELLTFLAAGVALNLAPGADVIFATASGLKGGLRAGPAAGLGVGLGGALHVSLAASGDAAQALLQQSRASDTDFCHFCACSRKCFAYSYWHRNRVLPRGVHEA
jgi:hypothetical protein